MNKKKNLDTSFEEEGELRLIYWKKYKAVIGHI